VHRAAETDRGIAPEQAMLAVRREPGARIKADRRSAQSQVGEFPLQHRTIVGTQALVGVDVEDPVADGVVERLVARRREIVAPDVIEDAGAMSGGDGTAAVRRPGIDNDDVVDDARETAQAAIEKFFLVEDDQSGRNQVSYSRGGKSGRCGHPLPPMPARSGCRSQHRHGARS